MFLFLSSSPAHSNIVWSAQYHPKECDMFLSCSQVRKLFFFFSPCVCIDFLQNIASPPHVSDGTVVSLVSNVYRSRFILYPLVLGLFFPFRPVYLRFKDRALSLFYYLPAADWRKVGFMLFSRALVQSEFIFSDNNYYFTCS